MSMLPTMKSVKCGVSRTKKISVEHDINKLISKYQKTGMLPVTNGREGVFIDVSNFGDFFESQNRVNDLLNSFNQLPSKVRRRFRGNPQEFVEFCMNMDDVKMAEAKALGMLFENPDKDKKAGNDERSDKVEDDKNKNVNDDKVGK